MIFSTLSRFTKSEMNTYRNRIAAVMPPNTPPAAPCRRPSSHSPTFCATVVIELRSESGVTVTSMNGTLCSTFVDEAQRLIAEARQVGSSDPLGHSLHHVGDLHDREEYEQGQRHDHRSDRCQQGQRRRQPGAEPLVEPIEQRREQVGRHRGHHDENEVTTQEVGAEQDGDGGRDRQRTLLCQRELGIHCGHWHTVARLRRRNPGLLSESPNAPSAWLARWRSMKPIDMRCIRARRQPCEQPLGMCAVAV